jgi:lysozyme family protein
MLESSDDLPGCRFFGSSAPLAAERRASVVIAHMGFSEAVQRVLELEGGYTDDPYDPGGETNFGISKKSYPMLDIEALTLEQAIAIYKTDWWDKHGYGRLPEEIGQKVFELAVNIGAVRAHRLLQEALQDLGIPVVVDGKIGPETMYQTTQYKHQDALLLLLKAGAISYYRGLKVPRYLAGWVRRAMA